VGVTIGRFVSVKVGPSMKIVGATGLQAACGRLSGRVGFVGVRVGVA